MEAPAGMAMWPLQNPVMQFQFWSTTFTSSNLVLDVLARWEIKLSNELVM